MPATQRHVDGSLSAGVLITSRFPPSERRLAAGTILLSSLTLFAVEPMVAKAALPWFGGSAQIWIACLAFFQAAFFAGNLYAWALARADRRTQVRVHGFLLVASLAFLPVLPGAGWAPSAGSDPLLRLFVMLTATVGLPFILLASTTPLVQSRLAEEKPGARSLYRLFALSNLGSLVALLAYPFVIEPAVRLRHQALGWSAAYGLFVMASLAGVWRHRRPKQSESAPVAAALMPSRTERALWFLLPAVSAALLLAVTQYVLRDIAAIPLLWVVPLVLYLLSLIVSFGWSRWYFRPVWYVLFALSVRAMAWTGGTQYVFESPRALFAVYAVGLLVCCLICHGELASLRPPHSQLTFFYLMSAAGSAAGGLAISLVAPQIFDSNAPDLPSVLAVALLLVAIMGWRRLSPLAPRRKWAGAIAGLALAILPALACFPRPADENIREVWQERNFYGTLAVSERLDIPIASRTRDLFNGNISHGRQFVAGDVRQPLAYYTRTSGVGRALLALSAVPSLRVGVVGLGAGTLASYGREGDIYRFYEIDPAVREAAEKFFSYLSDSPALWTIISGDARLSLESETPQHFDLLAIDAFTSDAIPAHLLTREAFSVYWRHLAPDGVLAVHVTNRFVDLAPVVAAAAREVGRSAMLISDAVDPATGGFSSDWVIVAAQPDFYLLPPMADASPELLSTFSLWTDDYSSVWRQMR